MPFASSTRSTNKVQLGIPQTASTSVFYATLSLSISFQAPEPALRRVWNGG